MNTDPAPHRYRVVVNRAETPDTSTLTLRPVDAPLPAFLPGQFAMLYAFGIGEIPVSVSGRCGAGGLMHTVRAVGAVSRAVHDCPPGGFLGVRGPFGRPWTLPAPRDADVVVVAGGLGLAPLHPLVRHLRDHRVRYRSVAVLIGARTPDDLLYRAEYRRWRADGLDVRVTVDRPLPGWNGATGLVTALLTGLRPQPGRCAGYVCGPEVMMRPVVRSLATIGMPTSRVELSLERNMQCGTGHCGHCQLGPLFVCRDGPVVPATAAENLLAVREL
ncbi:oxidoreductase [Virgisporangium aliadipatigenens]|uniref:Oxidoreductase n=1 Tax=Virgisporangium aliadipatigenens TaxID=741659 RepID=A0A8J3YQW1_9ACTN|nr:FAD/NAD(P)-binding protein [Virgisporangium aliadipatigenens]GIJ48143.1 oxidoreductase [Virgisporangium aliadipatigenens]